jgi:hypothetical protein
MPTAMALPPPTDPLTLQRRRMARLLALGGLRAGLRGQEEKRNKGEFEEEKLAMAG